jgi:hypothetical protein
MVHVKETFCSKERGVHRGREQVKMANKTDGKESESRNREK